ncbi:MAG: BON domain-containing protein [Actinoplanes sp.]
MDPWNFWHNDEPPAVRCSAGDTSVMDRIICRRVAERLLAEPAVRTRVIEISVQNRVVVLEGEVSGADARKLAGEIVWGTRDVYDVSNRLTVH